MYHRYGNPGLKRVLDSFPLLVAHICRGGGTSVAVSGDTVVVGAIGEDSSARGTNGDDGDDSAEGAGAAYVFTRIGAEWTQQANLKASNAEREDGFGAFLSRSGDALVIGAYPEDSKATGINGDQGDNSAINAGLNDAWFNPDTAGQGFFITVFPQTGKLFLAWFIYDTERPAAGTPTLFGDPGHRRLRGRSVSRNGWFMLSVHTEKAAAPGAAQRRGRDGRCTCRSGIRTVSTKIWTGANPIPIRSPRTKCWPFVRNTPRWNGGPCRT